MMEQYVDIVNIQRFSLHDGPGIRTTVFLRGCSLRCPWCCNPESWTADTSGLQRTNTRYNGIFSLSEVYELLIKDKNYYMNGSRLWKHGINDTPYETMPGGVTYSGGEPMIHMHKLESMLQMLNEENIHQAIETSLFCDESMIKIALKYLDLIYFDIKLLDKDDCYKILKGNIDNFKQNVKIVLKRAKKVIIRIPLIRDFTDTYKNLGLIIKYFEELEIDKNLNIIRIELLKGHNLGNRKYLKLGLNSLNNCVPSEDNLSLFMNSLSKFNIDIVLLSI